MRDSKRIKPFLEKMEDYWLRNPDLRFGQLIYNLCYNKDDENNQGNIFSVEDEKLQSKLEEEIEKRAKLERLSSLDS